MIEQGIDCTLSQLLETGIMHADAHAGNLLKVQEPPSVKGRRRRTATEPRLGYVDFGLLATVPVEVRDGLVCSVAELVFERNVTAVAQLFGELALIPDSVLQSPSEMEALGQELEAALFEVLVYPNSTTVSSTTIPQLRFDKLLNVLSRLVPRFSFELPPYFLNNARSLGTLEGMAREIQPSFNVLQFLYPYALQRIVANPSQSPVVEQTLNHLLTHPESGRIDRHKIRRLIHDVTLLTGYSKTRLLRDVLASPNGPRLVRRVVGESVTQAAGRRKKRGAERRQSRKRQSRASSRFFRL
jgi:predicted unusual protein kinase regulating ubiquinone biosynthesis (AarF/ABC1/UbiB family)